jgi:putative ABC transport system permease protein
MLTWWRDIRFGLRMLARNKGFTAVAILALALGIGPNVAIFSIIWATFLAPLPYPHANQLVVVWTHYRGQREATTADQFAEWAAAQHSFQELDFKSWQTMHLTNADHSTEPYYGQSVTPGYVTKMLGLKMALGRGFYRGEGVPGRDHLVILTHQLWETKFHSDAEIVGEPTLINDQPYTVVGVLAPGPLDRLPESGFMVPLTLTPGVHNSDVGNVFGRLKLGVTLAQAQAEMKLIDSRVPSPESATTNKAQWSVAVEQLRNDWLDHTVERNLWLLLAAVGLVLLIACANVANLLLARGASRQQELALRSAMGATRRQIVAQLLAESLTLAVLGGGIGIALGWGIMKAAMAILPLATMTVEAVVQVNVPVLAFAVGVTLLGGIVFGCAPAWQASHNDLAETLKQGSRSMSSHGRAKTQGVLVTTEFALALTLLAGAGLALHSFWNLSHIDLGINPEHLLTGFLSPKTAASRVALPAAEQIVATERTLLAKLRDVPGVQDAAFATTMPLQGNDSLQFAIAGHPSDPQHLPAADFEAVTPSFRPTLGVGLHRGRFLGDSDTLATQRVAVVNQSFVRRYFPLADPLTQQLMLRLPQPGQHELGPPQAFQVVGVYQDTLNNRQITAGAVPQVLVSLWQVPVPYLEFAARTAVDPGAVTSGLRAALAAAAPNLTMGDVRTMREVVSGDLTFFRFGVVLFGGFAAVALLLAALGIYGVMSFAVAQRTHEVGIRMALGAQKSEVVRLMIRSGLRLALPGMAVGLAGVLVLGRLMHSTLYGVGSVDYLSTLAVAALLLGVALLACWLPARRSAEVDPMVALREE